MQLSKKKLSTLLSHRSLARYLGIPVLLWFISGIVMVFIHFPRLDPVERIEYSGSLSSSIRLPDDLNVGYSIEAVMGKAMVRADKVLRRSKAVSLADIETNLALLGKSEFEFKEKLDLDQWTVQGKYNKYRPFYIFEDGSGKQLYISSKTGELVQLTTTWERISNYFGTVVHWIYFSPLRRRPALWGDVIIYLSALAFFMTLGGFYKGVKLFSLKGKYRKKRQTPFWGALGSHHYWGMFFGVFCLTWLLSGFFSMNPFDMFQFPQITAYEKTLFSGPSLASEDFQVLWNKNKRLIDEKKPWRVRFRTVMNKPIMDLYSASGITHHGGISSDILLASMKDKLREKGLISYHRLGEDDYFLPMKKLSKRDEVWRFKFKDGTWLDLGLKSGRILRKHNLSSKVYLVAFDGLHRLWLPGLHTRPSLRKLLVVSVSLACLFFICSGLYSYYRRFTKLKYLSKKMSLNRFMSLKNQKKTQPS